MSQFRICSSSNWFLAATKQNQIHLGKIRKRKKMKLWIRFDWDEDLTNELRRIAACWSCVSLVKLFENFSEWSSLCNRFTNRSSSITWNPSGSNLFLFSKTKSNKFIGLCEMKCVYLSHSLSNSLSLILNPMSIKSLWNWFLNIFFGSPPFNDGQSAIRSASLHIINNQIEIIKNKRERQRDELCSIFFFENKE